MWCTEGGAATDAVRHQSLDRKSKKIGKRAIDFTQNPVKYEDIFSFLFEEDLTLDGGDVLVFWDFLLIK